MKNRVITISREFGSGGRTIGKLAAEKLGIPCYDQEAIDRMMTEGGFPEAFVKERGEDMSQRWVSLSRTNSPTMQDRLWILQRKTITELAEKGPCVIVGRCADYILRDTADCLKAFIYAAPEVRADRIVHVYGEQEAHPMERLLLKDKHRAAYYQYYTDIKWGVVSNYHIALNSGVLGIEPCADILVELY